MSQEYAEFFEGLTGFPPYPYQAELGTEPWPDLVEVPTGLGKTAAVVVAWLWKRLQADADTPRRLVYCLPMRVLVEQTHSRAGDWLNEAAPRFSTAGITVPTVHMLMGGEVDTDWVLHPDRPAVIIGTQDMLLSRALMRGYGMSRYQWPIHFGLLHNDAMWIYDEVQLMGPALSTSAQLEAFRRQFDLGRPARSLWMSATLDADWLGTVDFRPHLDTAATRSIGDADRDAAGDRLTAEKRLARADVRLDRESAKSNAAAYVDDLADAVMQAHRPGTQTLVILNRVARTQALFRALGKIDGAPGLLLLHSRFREAERCRIEAALSGDPPAEGRIVVATQAVEAGVDISSATLFTELAPWSSLVQRFGRCNRRGEVDDGADVRWIDIDDDEGLALPYDMDALKAARATVEGLESAGIHDLPLVSAPREVHLVLRRKDFVELFDTEPDLSGFDIDISPYIRDPGTPQVQVFWRDIDDVRSEERPLRAELCPVSMRQIADHLKGKAGGRRRRYWTWDALEGRWRVGGRDDSPRPGSILMLDADEGGYDPAIGFDPRGRTSVEPLRPGTTEQDPASSDDPESRVGRFISLEAHTRRVVEMAETLAEALGLDPADGDPVRTAARWHDIGKAHPAFQTALLEYWPGEAGPPQEPKETFWAKSSGNGRLRYQIERDGEVVERRYFRHEVPSMLAWLRHGDPDDDLVAYLIAAHHGKVRLALRALPTEEPPPGETLFARGVWHGDVLPAVKVDGLSVPETHLDLGLIRMGRGRDGQPSWTERTRTLLEREGPFRLGWLEALLRIADQRASAEEREESAP